MAGETTTTTNTTVPGATTVPTQETTNSVAVGYTESDPVGPSAAQADDKAGLLAGEFKTPEELAAAYADLKKQLADKEGDPSAKAEGENKEQPEDGESKEKEDDDAATPKVAAIEHTEEATAEFKAKGLDIKAFTREFETTGQLSDESYAKLEKAGYDRALVDSYIAGQRVMAESQVKAVKDSIGGEEAFNKMAQWASANLSESEQAAYAKVLETANPDLITFAVQGLKARYDAANGTDPEVVVTGSSSSANDGKSRFKSWAEATSAMSDPRYNKDPAYRASIEEKLLRSNI